MGRPQAKHVRVNPLNPEAAGQCDRCDEWWQLRRLRYQYEWGGNKLYNLGALVCPTCYDKPQEQFRTIILPPDPPPLPNARTSNFAYEEQTVRITQNGGRAYEGFAFPASDPPWNAGPQSLRALQGGRVVRILQLNQNYPAGVTTDVAFVTLPKPPPLIPSTTGTGTQVFVPAVFSGI